MSLDPSKYSTLALTHVQYDSTDPLAKLLSLVTLSPIFLLCSYLTIILYRRELTFINALIGQVSCEALNWALKRSFRQPRPTDFLGSGYGMPSSHSQFLGFFSSFFLLHFYFHSPTFNKTSLISLLRKLEHALGMVAVFALTVAVCYSRYHLSYHTPAQILIGLGIGLLYGSIYYHFTETLTRRFSFSLQDVEKRMERNDRRSNPQDINKTIRDSNLRQRSPKPNRFSTSTSISTSKSQVISIRQSILDHPIAIAFRIRDSWLVWKDGGVEGEYGIWRREWENRRESSSSSSSSSITTLNNQPKLDQFISIIQGKEVSREKLDLMKLALNEADKCLPLVTAFSVGCIITVEALLNEKDSPTSQNQEVILSTGYSRELEGNTHAEQCALTKLISNYDLLSTSPANSSAKWNGNVVGDIDLNLYTTMEPCSERLSGQDPCVDRILKFNQENHLLRLSDLIEIMKIESIESSNNSKVSNRFVRLKIKRIFQGVKEPEDFVLCKGTRLLQENGISVEQVRDGVGKEEEENNWLELECLRIAKKGHQDQPREIEGNERRWK